MRVSLRRYGPRLALAVLALVGLVLTGCGDAKPRIAPFQFEAFSEQRFRELQAAGVPVLVDIHADWCTACKIQGEVLADFQRDYPECGLQILSINFDTQKDWVTHFQAPRQATLILFQGRERSWFSVAEIREEVIVSSLRRHLGACG